MLKLVYSTQMKKNVKQLQKRGKDLEKLAHVLRLLCKEQKLPYQFKDHQLLGKLSGYRECHIEPDWLLVYKIDSGKLILTATGTHSDIFNR
ncbi:MAG: type II toxin-antitoxin system YafQ family toxin [Planctomycetaceae bacterium]|nr:type II toxin-antitoxin system YafQ family toxin [Planctomycetaceae bacterium]